MPNQNRVVAPGPEPRSVLLESGESLTVPSNWTLLPPGDALVTRRVKAAGPTWTVQEKKGRKKFSRGVWADRAIIEAKLAEVEAERATPEYQRKLAAGRKRAAQAQEAYVEDFGKAVLDFLDFAPRHHGLAEAIAAAVTAHATPVGSGTVARTKRISVQQRSEAAVIAWMRHQTTAYDHMKIARIKGERRRVRRMLAQRSKELLESYRRGEPARESCPLARACAQLQAATSPADSARSRAEM